MIPTVLHSIRELSAEKKLPISCSSYNWTTFYKRQGLNWGEDLDFCFAQFRESGMTALEPSFTTPEEVKKYQPYLEKYQISMPSAYVNSVLHEEDSANESIENVLAIAENLKQSGTVILVTNPTPISWTDKIAKSDDQVMLQTEKLNYLGKKLKDMDIALAYHTHDSEMLAGAKEIHHVLQNTDPANVNFCLDAHWIFRGSQNSQIAVFDSIKMYGNRIIELHIRQSKNGTWTETFGPGDIDYSQMSNVFEKDKIRPHLVIEQAVETGTPNTLDGIAAHQISLKQVKKIFNR